MDILEIIGLGLIIGVGLISITRLARYAVSKDWEVTLLRLKGNKMILESLEEE